MLKVSKAQLPVLALSVCLAGTLAWSAFAAPSTEQAEKTETAATESKSEAPAADTKAQDKKAPATPAKAQAAGQVINSEGKGFSITLPADWKASSSDADTFLFYTSPSHNGAKATVNVNVHKDENLAVGDLGPEMKVNFKKLEGWQLVNEGSLELKDQPNYFVGSRFKIGEYEFQNLQYHIRGKKQRMYVLTFTSLAKDFSLYQESFKQMALSVQTNES